MKIAAVQMDVKILRKDYNLERILEKTAEAARAGAKVMIFPECALTGYCFSSREEAWAQAETVPGPATERFAAAAKRLGCTVVVGMVEREGDRMYNAAAVLGPDRIHGTYRKIHLPGLGLDRFVELGDKPFPLFETGHGKIGVSICYDCSFPESGRILKLKGAQLLAIPTNWPQGADSPPHTPHVRATENHLYVVAANRVGEERGFRFCGQSKIVHFNGQVCAEAGDTEDKVLYADFDLAAADATRVVRVPGEWEFDRIADRRPEMYTLLSEHLHQEPVPRREKAGASSRSR